VRGAPYHPQTQGKIERWHQTLKNRILLDNYYLPGDLERQIAALRSIGIARSTSTCSLSIRLGASSDNPSGWVRPFRGGDADSDFLSDMSIACTLATRRLNETSGSRSDSS
jgi:transposase InsO family protein